MNDWTEQQEFLRQLNSQRSQPSFAPADYIRSLVTLLAFLACAAIAYPLLSGASHTDILHGARAMAARASFGLVRRPLAGFGSEGGVVGSVFGLKSAASSLGTATLQSGLGGIRSIVKGASSSDTPAGLGNYDNSCYQNSVIQGLASLRSLPGFLRQQVEKGGKEAGMNEALLGMIEKLNDEGSNGSQLWLGQELKTMSTWQQQDAQEYFSKVLDKVDKEALRVVKQSASASRRLSLAEMSPDKVEDKVKEVLRNPLEGMLAQRVSCKTCSHSDGISLIPFNCLTVPLGTSSTYDIRDCLDEYTKLEEIDGVQCPKCTLLSFQSKLTASLENANTTPALREQLEARLQTVAQAIEEGDFSDEVVSKRCQIAKKQWASSTKTKQAVLACPPRSLVIHVNRSMFNEYTGAQTKNPAVVHFPSHLGLGPWTLGKMAEEKGAQELSEIWSMEPTKSMLPKWDEPGEVTRDTNFELRAVVTHSGRHENGHYVAYRTHGATTSSDVDPDEEEKTSKPKWWRLSDDDVTSVSDEFVLRQGGVFMLFYERVEEEASAVLTSSVDVAVPAAAGLLTPAFSAAEVPLPAISDEDLEFMAAEDEYVMARLPVSWEAPAKSGDGPRQVPTPPESVADSTADEATDTEVEDEQPAASLEPVKPIRLRTSSVIGKGRSKGSSESLRMGSRMVSAT